MNKKIHWKKGFFSTKYELFSADQKIGELSQNSFTMGAEGNIGKVHVKFQRRGFFMRDVEIIDLNLDKVVGEIFFNSWSSKAKINYDGNQIECNSNNIWSTKWSIFDGDEKLIRYKNSSTKGAIESNTDDPVLLLSGLFILNYFVQTMVILAVCVIVIAI